MTFVREDDKFQTLKARSTTLFLSCHVYIILQHGSNKARIQIPKAYMTHHCRTPYHSSSVKESCIQDTMVFKKIIDT